MSFIVLKVMQKIKHVLAFIILWQAEADMRCKMELIQQIRAMEATPVSRFKVVDLTSTSGAGLLGEMSIVEVGKCLEINNPWWDIF